MAGMVFVAQHFSSFLEHVAEHLAITAMTLLAAALLALALHLASSFVPAVRPSLLRFVRVLESVSGLALMMLLVALMGRFGGDIAALLALVFCAMVPLFRPLLALPEQAWLEDGRRHWRKYAASAFQALMETVRYASARTLGLVTLAAFVGVGGLGEMVQHGLLLSDPAMLGWASLSVILLGLLIDLLWEGITHHPASPDEASMGRVVSLAGFGALAVFTVMMHPAWETAPTTRPIVVGAKNFTEQHIAAEIIAQMLEHSGYSVRRRFGMAGTHALHDALSRGEVDVAVEYTGTAFTTILGRPPLNDAETVFLAVRREYAKRYGVEWLLPLGFSNSYVLAARKQDPQLRDIRTISELTAVAPNLIAAFDGEFAERMDGYRGLKQSYGLDFSAIRSVAPGDLYRVLRAKEVSIISAYGTDVQLIEGDMVVLEDDRGFFPPYDAAILVREELLKHYPALRKDLRRLSGAVDDATIRKLNAMVQKEKKLVEDSARYFWGTQAKM